jgi:hypothetical protein
MYFAIENSFFISKDSKNNDKKEIFLGDLRAAAAAKVLAKTRRYEKTRYCD